MSFYYPYVKERYKSVFIDILVILGFMLAVSIVLSFFDNVPVEVRITCFVLIYLYEPICISFGATIGQVTNKIRVRSNADPSKKLNIIVALWRSVTKYVLGILSLLFIHGNPKRRALHDFFANSVVISLDPIHFVETEPEISVTDENGSSKEGETYF
jgi:uncharacterized RDD family membrane protein YckC